MEERKKRQAFIEKAIFKESLKRQELEKIREKQSYENYKKMFELQEKERINNMNRKRQIIRAKI